MTQTLLPFAALIRSAMILVAIAAFSYALFSRERSASWILGLFCLGIYLGTGFLTGADSLVTLLFFLASGLLFLVEFMVPGFGIAGISGIALFGYALYCSLSGGVQAFLTLIASAVVVALIAKRAVDTEGGLAFVSSLISKTEAENKKKASEFERGDIGVTVTALRPTGKARFGETTVTVHSGGVFIEKGQPIEVTKINGKAIYVRARDSGA